MSDETDDNVEKVKPIWSRLEKILEKTESSSTTSPVDVIGFLNIKIHIERTALELSIIAVTDNGRTTHYPPNLKLAETISNYIHARLGIPVGTAKS